MNRLSENAENKIKAEFLSYIGRIIKAKRSRKNISQAELGECLGVSESTISRYEAGKQDMAVSMLPLISNYCQFAIKDYFVREDARRLAETFRELVYISATEPRRYWKESDSQVIAQIIREGDRELRIPVIMRPETVKVKVWELDKFQGGLDTKDVRPFTMEEMADYLMIEGNEDKCMLLESAGNILHYSKARKALTMEKSMAGFIIEDCLKEGDEELQKRLVAYYRKLCGEV